MSKSDPAKKKPHKHIDSPIVDKAAEWAFEYFKNTLSDKFVFHNFIHTKEIVDAAFELGDNSGLNQEELEIVALAGWFHDTGYAVSLVDHEAKSVEIATKFLHEQQYPEDKIKQVCGCIMATKIPQSPANLLEEVIADADLLHLGQKQYFEKADLLRVEWEKTLNVEYSDIEWHKHSIEFFASHHYYTKYAQTTFEKQRAANLAKLRKRLRKLIEVSQEKEAKKAEQEAKNRSKELKDKTPERGIETMFRITARNHMSLSAIADNKANIMISINALMLSIIVSVLGRKIEELPHLAIPTLMLVISCVITIVLATISTRPKVNTGKFTRQDIEQKKVNLLFFGNFFNTSLPDFQWGMHELMKDREYLYDSMIKDFYFLGIVLGKKYRFLRLTYTVFMYGLVSSVSAFFIAILYHYFFY